MAVTATTVHNFQESLERSYELSETLDDLYKRCFPHCVRIEAVTDIELQKKGVDKVIVLSNGKRVYLDEKVRDADFDDFLLEEYSVLEKRKVGWLGRDKLTDYIVYVIKPKGKAYFLPFLLLQKAWNRYYRRWSKKYRVQPADNGDYHTSNLAIPKGVLFAALFEAQSI